MKATRLPSSFPALESSIFGFQFEELSDGQHKLSEGSSIASQSPIVEEASMLQNFNCISDQLDLSSLVSHGSFIGPFRTQSHEPWTKVSSSQRRNHSLQCRAVCLDRVTETGVDSWRKNQDEVGFPENFQKKHPKNESSDSISVSSGRIFVHNDEQTNNDLLQYSCKRLEFLKASRLVAVMSRRNQIPHFDSCIKLIRGLVKIDYTDRAIEVLNSMVMSGGVPDILTYNIIISDLCKKQRIHSALDILEGMSVSGCPPDAFTYNAIVRLMLENGQICQAVSFWKAQLAKGCPPYISTSIILVELVCKYRGVIRAIEVLEDLAVHGCDPDLVIYNAMINVTSKRGNFGDTVLIVHDLLSHGMEPNTAMYTTILHSFINHGFVDEAIEILSFMNETSNPPTTVTYSILIKGFCKYGFLDRAIGLFTDMVSRDCCPDIITYNTLLSALCDVGMIDESVQILRCLENSNTAPNLITYNIMINGLAKKGYMEKAVGLYQQIMEEKKVFPDDITHRCLISGFCHSDMINEAMEILKVMKKKNHWASHSSYNYIIRRLCENRKLDGAIQVLKMLASSPYRVQRETFYSDMLRGLATAGMNDEAEKLHQKLIEWKAI
ncbi:hypothetical protein L6452_14035 [Arctium lappa]|uniref:Uncharacterized protein n=1 Tax=Arctium lappa TaxID=4217 RepID=A0ACB9CJS7_ARCLA|nr:hypothetical protein L6452_14035 [Arctium lappa]